MFQLVVCLVTAMNNVFDRKDGCNLIDLRCKPAVVSACHSTSVRSEHVRRIQVGVTSPTVLVLQRAPVRAHVAACTGCYATCSTPSSVSISLGCRSWFIIQVSTFAATLFFYISLWVFFIDWFLNTCHRNCRFSTPLRFYFSKSFLFPRASYFIFFLRTGLGRDSSVGIAMRYGLGGLGIEYHWRRDFPHSSRSALVPTPPLVQWVTRHSRG